MLLQADQPLTVGARQTIDNRNHSGAGAAPLTAMGMDPSSSPSAIYFRRELQVHTYDRYDILNITDDRLGWFVFCFASVFWFVFWFVFCQRSVNTNEDELFFRCSEDTLKADKDSELIHI